MQVNQKNYTTPVVCSANPSDWYINLRFFHAGKWHQRRFRKQLNRIADKKERKRQFDVLCELLTEWLAAGWNPILDPEFKERNIIKPTGLARMTFNEAMSFALEKKRADIAKKSYIDYHNILEITKDAAVDSGISNMPIILVERVHIMDLLERLFNDRKMSNHRYNSYLGAIRSMFSTLESWNVCKYNPAFKIKEKPVAESNKYKTYTDAEKIKIADFLAARHPRLLVFIQTIYHTGIRPKELLLLQVKDIDLTKQIITISPDLERENSKTKNIRRAPISNFLLPFISAMNLSNYPANFYVFGSPFEPGKGNGGSGSQKGGISGAMRTDFLRPSPFHAKRDTVTRLWKTLIKDELGIDKYMYAGKHTGADDKILAGIDLDTLRNLYGHTSKYMTSTYAKAIQEVFNSEIREKSPAFTGAKVIKIAS